MAKPTLTLTLQGEAAERLAALAEASGRTPEWYADFMIREYAGEEMRIVRQINEGIAEADAGRTVSHEDVMARIDATIARAAHRDAAE